jgi:hypothetical protein
MAEGPSLNISLVHIPEARMHPPTFVRVFYGDCDGRMQSLIRSNDPLNSPSRVSVKSIDARGSGQLFQAIISPTVARYSRHVEDAARTQLIEIRSTGVE